MQDEIKKLKTDSDNLEGKYNIGNSELPPSNSKISENIY